MGVLLTKSTMPIVNWVAEVLGWLMNGIYSIGVHNLGLCIIIFTLIIYAFMTPLQIKQQKFAKMNAVMSPELQKIQKIQRKKRSGFSDEDAGRDYGHLRKIWRISNRKLSADVNPDADFLCFVSGYY